MLNFKHNNTIDDLPYTGRLWHKQYFTDIKVTRVRKGIKFVLSYTIMNK